MHRSGDSSVGCRSITMPEGLEAEIYRRAADGLAGGRIDRVWVDPSCGDERELSTLVGARVEEIRRLGKHMLIDTSSGVLGVHFGMMGRLVLDGRAAIAALEYGSDRDDPRWDRLVMTVGGAIVRVNDPRRWSRYVLEPDTSRLGVDLFQPAKVLRLALDRAAHRRSPIKAVLLDQQLIAGIGNLIADEVLFTAGFAPSRRFDALDSAERADLARVISRTVRQLDRRGGSHTGATGPPVRAVGGRCPRDDSPFERGTVAGRTSLWCPVHQR